MVDDADVGLARRVMAAWDKSSSPEVLARAVVEWAEAREVYEEALERRARIFSSPRSAYSEGDCQYVEREQADADRRVQAAEKKLLSLAARKGGQA